MRHLLAAVFGLIALAASSPAFAAPHALRAVALVIGETDYVRLPTLTNPDKDARDIDHLLDDLGFDVERTLDARTDQLKASIDRFVADAKGADVALVYYAGHGIEAGGKDYIMGTDANIGDAASASATLIPLDDLLAELQKAVPINIVLLDACRTNPFTGQQVLDLTDTSAPVPIGQVGLEPVRGAIAIAPSAGPANLGALVGFSASPGQSALDGPSGANSPYASAILQHLSAGGYSFGDIMTMVSQEVYVDTGARQLPWTSSSLNRVLYFGREADTPTGDDASILADRRKLLLDIASVPEQSKAYVEAVATQENLKLADLYSMLEIIDAGKAGGAEDRESLLGVAKRVRDVLDDPILSAAPTDPELARLDALATKAIAAGALKLAFQYRQQEAARAGSIEKSLDGQQAQIDATRKELAGVYARVAEAAMYTLNAGAESNAYTRAAREADLFDKSISLKLRLRAADAAAGRGDEGDPRGYAVAAALYEDILKAVPPTDRQLWGDVHLKLGWVLWQEGNQNNDHAVRLATVDAAKAALTVFTQSDDYRKWNEAQRLLGWALKDSEQFGAAQAALATLLAATPVEKWPVDWALDEQAYGKLFFDIGQWNSSGTTELTQAVSLLEAAAKQFKRFDAGNYARTLGLEASAQVLIGVRTRNPQTLRDGIAAGRVALGVVDRNHRLLRADLAGSLGKELVEAARIVNDVSMAREGLATLAKAEQIRTEKGMESDWAMMREYDGDGLTFVGTQLHDVATLKAAIAAFDDAFTAFSAMDVPGERENVLEERQSAQYALNVELERK